MNEATLRWERESSLGDEHLRSLPGLPPGRSTCFCTNSSPFAAKTPEQIQAELWGFTSSCADAALRFHETGAVDDLIAMFPGMIEFHLPSGAAKPPAVLKSEFRLNQDLGLDSLALTEIAFKMDELFGVPIEIREMGGIVTVGDFKTLLMCKFGQS